MLAASSCWGGMEPTELWPPEEDTTVGEVELQRVHVEAEPQQQLQGASSQSEHLGAADEAEVQL